MVNKKDDKFMPVVAIEPNQTIKEHLDYLGMSQMELAIRLGITTKHLSNIINGKAPITYETALKLESVIGPSAQFWMNLETNYQLNKVRLKEQEKLIEDLELLKRIPYKKMSDLKWIKSTTNRKERVLNCRKFFGVSELGSIQNSYDIVFRKQKEISNISDLSTLAWIRKAEIEALNIEVEKFNKAKLKKLIPIFKKMTRWDLKNVFPKMQKLCAECGVALLFIPYLSKTYICGVSIWKKNKVILALSGMGKRVDGFWFTFFHELAHLINHSNKQSHINYENINEENEANFIASNYLILEKELQYFIDNYDYKNKNNIVKYSKEIEVAPFILLGRLQYEGLLEYHYHRDLLPSLEIIDIIEESN